jgi:hypothetical protein
VLGRDSARSIGHRPLLDRVLNPNWLSLRSGTLSRSQTRWLPTTEAQPAGPNPGGLRALRDEPTGALRKCRPHASHFGVPRRDGGRILSTGYGVTAHPASSTELAIRVCTAPASCPGSRSSQWSLTCQEWRHAMSHDARPTNLESKAVSPGQIAVTASLRRLDPVGTRSGTRRVV